jgi:hypothetical protein
MSNKIPNWTTGYVGFVHCQKGRQDSSQLRTNEKMKSNKNRKWLNKIGLF